MSAAGDEVVLYAAADSVACITLNRPERLNGSNGAVSRGLTAAFTRAGEDPGVRAILLRGAGRAFCAGADPQVLNELSDDPTAPNSGSGGLRYDGLMLLPKPVIAAVHGACVGIGLALACAADIRLAADDAVFVAPFAKLGLCAEGGLAWLLQRTIGPGNAAEMLLSARRVDAVEALAKGLVAQVLPAAGFADAALAYTRDLASGAPSSFAAIKRQLREAATQDFEMARAEAAALAPTMVAGADFREAVAARKDKRGARFEPVVARFDPPVSEG